MTDVRRLKKILTRLYEREGISNRFRRLHRAYAETAAKQQDNHSRKV